MNKGIDLNLDTWIVQARSLQANLCQGLGNSYKPAVTKELMESWLFLF